MRFLDAGESHGPGLTVILEGMPANLKISPEEIDKDLKLRQLGYGRGGRQKIEKDKVQILSGIRQGKTLGSPITLFIENNDFKNWSKIMSPILTTYNLPPTTKLRPGHADLAGTIKYNQNDLRNILERASARETATRVAIGALAKKLLSAFKVKIESKIISVGEVNVYAKELNKEAKKAIDIAKEDGDTLGGIFEISAKNVPVGLGSHVHYDRKLDAAIASSLMSIQAIKAVEIGAGIKSARRRGSEFHDEIFYKNGKIVRGSNNAGGIEGGISNGEPIIIRAALKPISTLAKALNTVDLKTKKPTLAHVERHDICAIESAAVIGEAALAFELAKALLEKFGGDSIEEILAHYKASKTSL
ncbi:MAG: chorismate synthase [Candidatus Margulisbacteria bacterium]|nr:chorismate synthase [Candidatus Margulisiibacteriota bacterium]